MQIRLPDHPNLASKAAAEGFSTIEEYVLHLVEEDAGPFEVNGQALSESDWLERFADLLNSAEPGNPDVDDSRESIYRVR